MKGTIKILTALAVWALAAGPMIFAAGTAFLGPNGQETAKIASADQAQASDIGTVTITLSGVGRPRKTTVIRYRKSDFTIIGVNENGKEIPPDKFGRYEEELRKALEYPRIRDLLDRIDAFKKALKSKRPASPEQHRQLDTLLRDLDSFLSQISPGNKKALFGPRYDEFTRAAFQKLARALLTEGQFLSPGEDVLLILRKSGCALNGRDLPQSTSDKILELWEECFGTPIKAGERIIYIFDPDKEGKGEGTTLLSVDSYVRRRDTQIFKSG